MIGMYLLIYFIIGIIVVFIHWITGDSSIQHTHYKTIDSLDVIAFLVLVLIYPIMIAAYILVLMYQTWRRIYRKGEDNGA